MDTAVARILDANQNRAREALRVIEESVRFAGNVPDLTAAIKQCRHDLSAALRQLPAEMLLEARDTAGDVGTSVNTDSERHRDSVDDVVTASFKRLTEALRVLEEYGKVVDVEFAAAIEALRYRVYDLEAAVRFEPWRRRRFGEVRLYVLITESLCHGPWLTIAEAAIDGGADCLQLREKGMDDAELLRRALALRELTRRRSVLFVMNDRPDIARLVEADGIHLGQDDMPVAAARRIVGPRILIGKSTHTIEQARAALAESPDYIAVGPMFDSTTKPQKHIAGPQTLAAVLGETDLPHVAIGGITVENVNVLRQVGCRCIAVCSAVISRANPTKEAKSLRRALTDEPTL